ncbi:MAG: tRNA (adenosine(37)-N6)-threonylcarbamoyltransferase complex transferase subunit TsaD [Patescibacteria group bacterium]|nr:tRNA (adenosine(37)-N6)-threonylcarbamoyltransferase complex transferase subunit TsaD [Patescibacteria group bacterium]MDE2589210.1 tRNA (adenosine(37)-N6)-threonylcarbamoyltransferase complex transferase subunit TsaD [Patescibacteria group bacterium]
MKLLGIETSCDETAAAIIETTAKTFPVRLLSNSVASSVNLHGKTGGIIPEIAAREQIKFILPVISDALTKANLSPQKLDAIAVTVGPGLIGSLLVGVETAKTLSMAWNKPLIPVNHLFGHLYANWIATDSDHKIPEFPILGLIVSGGHTDLVIIENHKKIRWLAGTRDDAAGEAFDKIGRLLNLSYPAGPMIERLAKDGNPKRFSFPRPLLHEPTYDFSFSGLKTAVLRQTQKLEGSIDEHTIRELARATQDAIIDVLVEKTVKAAQEYNVNSIILGGGVAANQALREQLQREIGLTIPHLSLYVPPKNLCTDNGAMIAAAGFYNYKEKSWKDISANPELYFD